MLLKFKFKNWKTGWVGTSAIAIFDKDGLIISQSDINIISDDFVNAPCKIATFRSTPSSSSSVYCATYNVYPDVLYSEIIIEIPDIEISKIGMSVLTTTYNLAVTVYICDESTDDSFKYIGYIHPNADEFKSYTMVYSDINYVVTLPEDTPSGYNPIVIGNESNLNSIIFKNPQETYLFDLSLIGTSTYESEIIQINQENHYFEIGDVLFYNVVTQKFEKAIAENSMFSEVCGIVSKVISLDYFEIVSSGEIVTDRYNFDTDTVLYLSDVTFGKLVSIPPENIVKEIATQITNGINVNIKRAFKLTETSTTEEYEAYTQEELDEIILNIW